MKKDTNNKIKLGIFISIGILLFIIGIYFIGERQQLFRSTFRVSGIFRDVGGLQAGNNVRFSGINVGTVENISVVSDTSVKVEILIEESTRKFIKKDAVASIGSEGLMGNKILIITPGTGGKMEIENNDVVETVQPINLDDILTSFKKTVENTSSITSDLALITSNIRSGKGIVNMDEILLSLKSTIDKTSNITSDLSEITGNMKSGRGTIGKLLMDSSLAQRIDSTFMDLKEGANNLKQGSSGLKTLIDSVNSSYTRNIDSTFINLKKGSAQLNTLLEKAHNSWLLWGF
jgi:phospholipid/cholesterol/gamma-HCH transport system substrate-binding protein